MFYTESGSPASFRSHSRVLSKVFPNPPSPFRGFRNITGHEQPQQTINMTSTVIATPSPSQNLSHIFINRDHDQQQEEPMSPSLASPPLRSPLFMDPAFLDPLMSQLLYVQTEGCTGVAGRRIPNDYTTSEGSFALTTSRHPPKVKKVSFANIITTNEGDAYIVPPALQSPSSDGSTDSLGSSNSAASGSSRSSADEPGTLYWTHPTRENRGKGGPR